MSAFSPAWGRKKKREAETKEVNIHYNCIFFHSLQPIMWVGPACNCHINRFWKHTRNYFKIALGKNIFSKRVVKSQVSSITRFWAMGLTMINCITKTGWPSLTCLGTQTGSLAGRCLTLDSDVSSEGTCLCSESQCVCTCKYALL